MDNLELDIDWEPNDAAGDDEEICVELDEGDVDVVEAAPPRPATRSAPPALPPRPTPRAARP